MVEVFKIKKEPRLDLKYPSIPPEALDFGGWGEMSILHHDEKLVSLYQFCSKSQKATAVTEAGAAQQGRICPVTYHWDIYITYNPNHAMF